MPETLMENFENHQVSVNGVDINYRIAGKGKPLLLLHGFPQTHIMWHPIADELAQKHTVICADLRGYGDSSKPKGSSDHHEYSKREMARDMVLLMEKLGFDRFQLVGHDRGGRVSHRLCLDHPERVEKVTFIDIIPTLTFFESVCQITAKNYYHWFFLTQPTPFPEKMISNSRQTYLHQTLGGLGSATTTFADAAIAEYERCFTEETIHSICEDYRAADSIDLEHDRADRDMRIVCPTLILWGENGLMHKHFDFIQSWCDKADIVTGHSIKAGHFLIEEAPKETLKALELFLD